MVRKNIKHTSEFYNSITELCIDNTDGCAQARRTLLSSNCLTYFSQAITSGTFFTALLIAMGASETYIGYVTMATTLCMAIQFPAPLFWERLVRRKTALLTLGVIGDLLTYLGLPCIALLPIALHGKLILYMLLTLATGGISQFCMPARNAWTMQSIPFAKRISYTSITSMTQIVINIVSVFMAGAFLDTLEMNSYSAGSLSPTLTAIFILRIFACIAALFSSFLMAVHVKEFSYTAEQAPTHSLSLLLKPIKNRQFLSAILIPCLWALIGGMIGNYFSLYLIETVKMSYTMISSASIISTPVILLITPVWARLLRKHNWFKIMAWAILGYCLAYFCNVLISEKTPYFYFIAIIIGHLFSPAITMVSNNLIYLYIPEENRTTYFAFYSLLTTFFTLIGQAIGTCFVTVTTPLHLTFLGIPIGHLQLVSALAAVNGVILAFVLFTRYRVNLSSHHKS